VARQLIHYSRFTIHYSFTALRHHFLFLPAARDLDFTLPDACVL
jgi:hypothetical protein